MMSAINIHPQRRSWLLKRAALAGGVLLALTILGTTVGRKSSKGISGLAITIKATAGEQIVKEADIRSLLSASYNNDLTEQPVANLDIKAFERAVEGNPFVLDADVFIDAQNRMQVKVWQRELLVRVMDATGGNYYLDATGKQVPPSRYYTPRTVVATGYWPVYNDSLFQQKDYPLYTLWQFTALINKDLVLQPWLEQIHRDKQGNSILYGKLGDFSIVLGDLSKEPEQKIKRVKKFLKETLPHKGWSTYSRFDFRWEGQVIGTLRKSTPSSPPPETVQR